MHGSTGTKLSFQYEIIVTGNAFKAVGRAWSWDRSRIIEISRSGTMKGGVLTLDADAARREVAPSP